MVCAIANGALMTDEFQDAELSSYLGNPKAFRLYDLAVRYVFKIYSVEVSYLRKFGHGK